MAEPTDLIVPMLRELRGDMLSNFQKLDARMDVLEAKMNKLSGQQRSYREALSADTLLSRLVTGEFEERIEALERKIKKIETER